MTYSAIVSRISTRPHPNADRLQLGLCSGFQVIVGLDTKDGDLGVFFPCEGQLSEEFCLKNNLLRKHPTTGEKMSGYMDANRRVRVQKFRGEMSFGLWVPASYFDYLGGLNLEEGAMFTEVGGEEVCQKYYTPKMRSMQGQGKSKNKKAVEEKCRVLHFAEHFNTVQLRFVVNSIPAGSILTLTEKVHGTSARSGTHRVLLHNPWWRRWLRLKRPERWMSVCGTRRVTLDPLKAEEDDNGYYSGSSFRNDAHKGIQTHKGETVYYELVGYCGPNTLIMPAHAAKDEETKKLYPKLPDGRIEYRYGCNPGEFRVYVYRITMTNEDGVVTELPWPQVLRRCKELGLTPVPEFSTFVYDGDVEKLIRTCMRLSDGPSTLDGDHPREGVCVRVEAPNGYTNIFKLKGATFCVMEDIATSFDEYVDPEELS